MRALPLLALLALPPGADTPTKITVGDGAMAVVSLGVAAEGDAARGRALDVIVDGTEDSQVVVFPGAERASQALVGPLTAGTHEVSWRASALWPLPRVPPVISMRVEPVAPGHPDYERLRWAPRIGLRADTIGTWSDLPLLLYAERPSPGRLRYSVIFSNEDGGTPARTLLARWGRPADIEWVTETWMEGARRLWTFQGPDHDTRRGPADPSTIGVVVSSLNNIFLPGGTSRASVRMVPRAADLREATRESLLDAEPWTYAAMARELAAEGKLDGGGGRDASRVADLRHYAYAEAFLRLREAAAVAWIEPSEGAWQSSHRGSMELALSREGWVRTAVEIGPLPPRRLAWECLALSELPTADAGCEIDATRLFRLGGDYRPGGNLMRGTTLRLKVGEMATLSLLP